MKQNKRAHSRQGAIFHVFYRLSVLFRIERPMVSVLGVFDDVQCQLSIILL